MAKQSRRACTGKDAVSQHLAADKSAVGFRHWDSGRVKLGGNGELGERAIPRTINAEKLEQEGAQARVAWRLANLAHQRGPRRPGITRAEHLLRISHWS